MSRKLAVIFVLSIASFTSSFIVNVHRNKTVDFSELSEPRTVDKSFNLLYNLYKMFKSSHDKKPSKRKHQMVPYDGLYYGTYNENQPEWEDHSHVEEETSIVKEEKKKKDPQFWLLDNFAKKNNLLLMTKILLKLIIFKKIVKFIAVVCLLFFIPTLNDTSTNSTSSEENTSEHSRNLDVYGNIESVKELQLTEQSFSDKIDYRSKEILTFAIAAVEGFSQDIMVWCVAEHDAFCRFRTMFDNVDQIWTIDK